PEAPSVFMRWLFPELPEAIGLNSNNYVHPFYLKYVVCSPVSFFLGAASPITVRRPKTSPVFTKHFLFCYIIKNLVLPQIWFAAAPAFSPALACTQAFLPWALLLFPRWLVLRPQTHTQCQ